MHMYEACTNEQSGNQMARYLVGHTEHIQTDDRTLKSDEAHLPQYMRGVNDNW